MNYYTICYSDFPFFLNKINAFLDLCIHYDTFFIPDHHNDSFRMCVFIQQSILFITK